MLISACLLASSLITCEWHRPGTAPRLQPKKVEIAGLGAPPLAPRLARRAGRLVHPDSPQAEKLNYSEPLAERFGPREYFAPPLLAQEDQPVAMVVPEPAPARDRGKKQTRRKMPAEPALRSQDSQKKKVAAAAPAEKALAYAVPDSGSWLSSLLGSGNSGERTKTEDHGKHGTGYEAVVAAARRYGPRDAKFEKLARDIAYTESRGRCGAVSSAKALGVMQTKYGTARMMGYKGSPEGLKNCRTGAEYGVKYLAYCHNLAKGDTRLTSLCYNQGHGVLLKPEKYGKLANRKEAVNYIKVIKSRGWRM